MKLKGFKLCSMLLLSWVLWLVSWLALHVVTYLPVLTDLSGISFWTLNNRTFWYSLKRNAWTFCNHMGTKIRVWASEIKTVSIQPIASSFVGACYQFSTKSGDPSRTNSWENRNLEFSFTWRIQCSEQTTFVNNMSELEKTLKKIYS